MPQSAAGKVGPSILQDGAENEIRLDRQSSQVVTDAHGRYHEPVSRGAVFSAYLDLGTAIAAGNIKGATAAASTNFCIWNPSNSGKMFSILSTYLTLQSGTPPAGPVYHGFITNHNISLSNTAGIIKNNLLGGGVGSIAGVLSSAAGSALTGGTNTPQLLRPMNAGIIATAQATTVLGVQPSIDPVDGGIIIPPGMAYLPLWEGAGTTVGWSFGMTWEELPA